MLRIILGKKKKTVYIYNTYFCRINIVIVKIDDTNVIIISQISILQSDPMIYRLQHTNVS